jgi:Fe-S-cluster-containing hydrogenase component 2
MDAFTLVNDVSIVSRDYCIRCGIYIPTCPAKAIKLQKKEIETITLKNTFTMYMKISDKKGYSWRKRNCCFKKFKILFSYLIYYKCV